MGANSGGRFSLLTLFWARREAPFIDDVMDRVRGDNASGLGLSYEENELEYTRSWRTREAGLDLTLSLKVRR